MHQSEPICISVIVSCRNEIRHIRTFLGCLFHQDLRGLEMEILIADGMSEDGTRAVLSEFDKKSSVLRVIDNPEKIAATGLNHAIAEANGEIILRMDAHSIYAPDYVRTCVEVLQETNADNVGGPALTRAEGYIPQAIAHAFHVPFAVGNAKFRDPHYEGPASTVPYGCWRKSTLDCIGPFDEEMVRGQDDELNFRILASGGKLWQSPKIVSWYQPRSTLSALSHQFFQNGFWKVAAVRKHGRPASLRNLVPISCLIAGIILPILAGATSRMGWTSSHDGLLAALYILAGLYFSISLSCAIIVAKREGWRFLAVLPVVFATYQLSYALGFLLGLFHRPTSGRPPSGPQKVNAATTR
ncbi:MAG TPA: glycosyltransferase family 2 protein [Candidatus Saccharimonadales bacterium]|jgi:succinoglycan biosynthesis protein ExoA|nr:glycosyltransferase family 2 protein [Candidatus Saccharimonadales bacterium]